MGLFRAGREQRLDSPTNSLIELLQRRMSPTLAGVSVTADSAMTHGAVYECVDLIADLISTMPVDTYRKQDGRSVETPTPPVLVKPSMELDAINWRRVIVICWLLRGNGFGLVGSSNGAVADSVELIHPDRVGAKKARPDQPAQWFLDLKPVDLWPAGPLWHAPGKALNPGSPFGCSVLEHAQSTIGLGLAASKFGAQFFNSGGIPTAALMNDKPTGEDGAKRVKGRFLDAMAGTREPIVMGDGWKYQQIQIAPNESQFLETIKANRADVAGFFRVPPEMIGAPSGSNMTYSNVESRGIDLLRFCVGQWVVRLETALGTLLPTGPDYVKLNVDSLLRSDLSARYTAHGQGIRAGYLSVNDVRAMEDMPPVPNGDEYLWPPYRAFPIDDDQGDPVAATAPAGGSK